MFIAVGNVDHDEIVERVNHVFGALSDVHEPRYRPASLDWPVKPVVVEYCDKAQATFQISFRGVTGADPRRHAQTLLASILGGDSSSRLFRSVRDRHGLAYSISAEFGSYSDHGEFCVSAGVSQDSLEKALSLCGHELKELTRKPVGRQELARRREKFASLSVILSEDCSESEYDVLSMCLKVYKKIVRPEEEAARIRSISAPELQSLAAEIFRPENCSLALSLPKGCKALPEKLREALLNG
jgi:predicted Zn-dependent peptidase